ncbi:MAG: hypothetical protein RIR26_1798 [Pseudomonadota bacterium]|jgi:hypothetical protein
MIPRSFRPALKFLLFFLVLSSPLAFGNGSEEKSLPAVSFSDSNANWRIEPWPSRIEVLLPGHGLRTRLKSPTALPDDTVVYISSGEEKLELIHASGTKAKISGRGIYHLDESFLWSNSDVLRTALDSVPSNAVKQDDRGLSAFENLLSFFTPRVPYDEPVPQRVNGPDDKTVQPIRPVFPGPVHFIETTELPVQIGLEWLVEKGQVDPHSVYLWSEFRFVNAPNAIVRGGRTFISLSKYGRYYWQVEDASRRFLSVPRTLIVVKPGGRNIAETEEEEMPEEDKDEKDKKEEKNVKTIGGMQLTSPLHNTYFFGCGISKLKPLSVPLRVDVRKGEFDRFEVDVLPKFEKHALRQSISKTESVVKGNLLFRSAGDYELRPALNSLTQNRILPLSVASIHVNDLCAKKGEKFNSEKIENFFDEFEEFPAQGALNFMQLAQGKSP